MVTHQNQYKTMDLHHDVNMDHIMISYSLCFTKSVSSGLAIIANDCRYTFRLIFNLVRRQMMIQSVTLKWTSLSRAWCHNATIMSQSDVYWLHQATVVLSTDVMNWWWSTGLTQFKVVDLDNPRHNKLLNICVNMSI